MQALRYAARPMAMLKYFGMLCNVLVLSAVVSLTVSLWFCEYLISFRYGIVAVVIFCLGTGLMRLPAPKSLLNNEAMVITALIFLFAPLAMTWPMIASGLGFLDALFEAISAVTTTGLTTSPTPFCSLAPGCSGSGDSASWSSP